MHQGLVADLDSLRAEHRLRVLTPREGVDFASNDYLGLASDPLLADAARAALDRGVPIGSGGSRLLRGNDPEHEALEAEAAAFFGSETALWFPCGFSANSALIATLPQSDDLVVHDTLIHASVHEGLRMTRAAVRDGGHNDAGRIDDAVATWRRAGGKGQPWIVVESLYSMDGDFAALEDLAIVAGQHDAILVIDEAHATGVYGPKGQGLSHPIKGRSNVITLHTCGKALGAEGALLCGPKLMRDFIVNRARAMIFSTAPSPLMAAIVRAILPIIAAADDRRAQLAALVAHAGSVLGALPSLTPTGSAIQPLILGENARTMTVASGLQAAGFDVRGIRPPTVPVGEARLRIALTLNATPDDIDALAVRLHELLG